MRTVLDRAPFTRKGFAAALVLLCGASVGQAAVITWTASLTGAAESPPNASPGIGFTQVNFDTVALTMHSPG